VLPRERDGDEAAGSQPAATARGRINLTPNPEDIYEQMALTPIDLLARIVAMRAPLSVALTD
jgi:hypothetical protein